ncbi:MAG: hypothetical protein ACLS3M_11110 [Collinsella sp.]
MADGSISIDGQDVRDVTQQSLRRATAWCSRMSICLTVRLARTSPTASQAPRQKKSPRPPAAPISMPFRVAAAGLRHGRGRARQPSFGRTEAARSHCACFSRTPRS